MSQNDMASSLNTDGETSDVGSGASNAPVSSSSSSLAVSEGQLPSRVPNPVSSDALHSIYMSGVDSSLVFPHWGYAARQPPFSSSSAGLPVQASGFVTMPHSSASQSTPSMGRAEFPNLSQYLTSGYLGASPFLPARPPSPHLFHGEFSGAPGQVPPAMGQPASSIEPSDGQATVVHPAANVHRPAVSENNEQPREPSPKRKLEVFDPTKGENTSRKYFYAGPETVNEYVEKYFCTALSGQSTERSVPGRSKARYRGYARAHSGLVCRIVVGL